jgi:hypothetical protein
VTLNTQNDDFMDTLFRSLEDVPPHGAERDQEDASVHAVLGRLGVDPATPVVVPVARPTSLRLPPRTLVAAFAAALVFGVLLGRFLPHPDAVIATIAMPAPESAPVVLSPPATEQTASMPASEPADVVPEPDRSDRVAVAHADPVAADSLSEPPEQVLPLRVAVHPADAGPGLDLDPGALLYIEGKTGTLEAGAMTFLRGGNVRPRIDRVHFPELGLYALPVGTVFSTSSTQDLALVSVTDGEVHLVLDDGTRLGSVREGESVAVGRSGPALRMVSVDGLDAAGLAVLFPDLRATDRAIQRALVALRLRSLTPDLVRDVRDLETLEQ